MVVKAMRTAMKAMKTKTIPELRTELWALRKRLYEVRKRRARERERSLFCKAMRKTAKRLKKEMNTLAFSRLSLQDIYEASGLAGAA